VNVLPSSIEAYLRESGFSDTEMLVLTRLLERDSFTIRELGSLTGKSTGILDQAMKKLLSKKIAQRELINDQPRYSIKSLDAIIAWVDEDRKERKATLDRRHQDFESFIGTLKLDKARPEMQHYTGEEGIKRAYKDLLALRGEMLHYLPVTTTADEDPLRIFRVEYFRERRKQSIFSRMIAHDTPLGRRFQSRDPFEYRETKLVPENLLPITFEKIIVGEHIACLNHGEQKACIMHYPEMAAQERALFETLWRMKFIADNTAQVAAAPPPSEKLVPLSTRTLSSLREFFLSRKSIAVLAGLGVLSGLLTYGIYRQTSALAFKRMQDQVRSIAATAVFQFDPKDIEALRVESDWKKPEWAKVVNQLKQIRMNNENIFFVYMFRKSPKDPNRLEFVADSHSMNPYANTDNDPFNNVDVDGNGIINSIDVLQWPGQEYPPPQEDVFRAFDGPLATDTFYEDSWGKYVTGYAPIKDSKGESIAVLAIDIQAKKLDEFTSETFAPIFSFFLLFFLFIVIRLTAFSRSLFQELWEALQMKKLLTTFITAAILSGILTYGLYSYSYFLNLQKIREKALSIAATGALQFEAQELATLQTSEDIRKPAYEKAIEKLNGIRNQNPSVRYAYIMRPTDEENTLEFVADADSLDPAAKKDLNGDGRIDDADWLSPPGEPYDISNIPAAKEVLQKGAATVDKEPYTDQWGTFITGHAPIKDTRGEVVAVLGVDIFAQKIRESTRESFKPFLAFSAFFLLLILTRLIVFNRPFLKKAWRTLNLRSVLASLALCAMIAMGVTYGAYRYTLKIMSEEIGTRLMSIAVTAASQIDPNDLEPLRFARDMRREEYQRVFRILNDVRDKNANIRWAYILRKSKAEGILEFVVDADSNFFLPAFTDYNEDNILTENEENVAPGVAYAPNPSNNGMFGAFQRPVADFFYTDQWGTFISGYAPIKDKKGNSVAIIGVDMDVSNVYQLTKDKFSYWLWFTGMLLVFALLASLVQVNFKKTLK